jgi:acetyltransferase-like isoleucine patch superfamily enzyme
MKNCKIGENVTIIHPSNMYECELSDDVFVGPFVEIQKNVKVGKGTRISSHSFICEGVEIGERVFIAHGVMFVNDLFDFEDTSSWIMRSTKIGNNVRIGSNATILPVEIGDNSIIGAGAVVTKNVPSNTLLAGNPAKIIRSI